MDSVLGDRHNFGRQVKTVKAKVLKPRPTGIEWLFLSKESPLRNYLEKLRISCLEGFPDLRFDSFKFEPTLCESKVDFVAMDFSKPLVIKEETLHRIGSLIGFVHWFGIGDLHSENIFLGSTTDGRELCAPIDIESIFEKHYLPSQSLLLPSRLVERKKSGLFRFITKLEKNFYPERVAIIISSYLDTLWTLDAHKIEILNIINRIYPLGKIVSRVILKPTKDYLDHISKKTEIDLYHEEELQLENSDIPYFFKYLNSDKILFWKTGTHFEETTIDINDCDKLAQQVRSIDLEKLLSTNENLKPEFGILQIAKSFDFFKSQDYQSVYRNVTINYDQKLIKIKCLHGKYQCRRY